MAIRAGVGHAQAVPFIRTVTEVVTETLPTGLMARVRASLPSVVGVLITTGRR